jgi:hypothetical protein
VLRCAYRACTGRELPAELLLRCALRERLLLLELLLLQLLLRLPAWLEKLLLLH